MFKQLTRIEWWVGLAMAFLTLGLIVQFNYRQLGDRLYPNDLISWVLPANAALHGRGAPYVTYWDIKPPGLLLMTAVWASVTPALWWFHILNLLMVATICWAYWRVLMKTFPWYQSAVLYVPAVVIFFGITVHSQLIPSEVNGLFWSLLGLFIVLSKLSTPKRAFWAMVCFGLAGQMKEVFAFTWLSLLPMVISTTFQPRKVWGRVIASLIAGMIVAMSLVGGYLMVTHSVGGYQQVLAAKSKAFSLRDVNVVLEIVNYYRALQYPRIRFIRWNYQFAALGMAAVVLGWWYAVGAQIIRLTKAKTGAITATVKLSDRWWPMATLLGFWLGMWFGYLLQNRYGAQYELAILFSTFMFVGVLGSVIVRWSTWWLGQWSWLKPWLAPSLTHLVVSVVVLGILAAPHRMFIDEILSTVTTMRPGAYIHRWLNLEAEELLSDQHAIRAGTQPNDCIEAVYGWAIGEVYHYAERRPCARHFIPNIVTDDYVAEYRQSLLTHPPAAVYYSEAGSDINVLNFERRVFPYRAVLASCYIVDSQHSRIYWPKPNQDLTNCVNLTFQASLVEANKLEKP